VTVNEVPGNEAALNGASVSQTSEARTPISVGPGDHEVAVPRSLQRKASRVGLALLAAIAAWLVPGLGHLLLGRWGRALVFFIAVAGLVLTGYWLRGNVFPPHSADLFGALGYLSDVSTGVLYYFSRFFEAAGPDVSRAAGDYGTRFIAAAGVVNVLAVLDAIEIATGRRS
jgi:hypothetical protein